MEGDMDGGPDVSAVSEATLAGPSTVAMQVSSAAVTRAPAW